MLSLRLNAFLRFSSVQSLSRVQLFCDPMDYSMPGFPVHHQLPELTQIHVHQVSDAIQPSHPLLSPSPPAFSLSQHQGLFQRVSSSHQVAKVLATPLQPPPGSFLRLHSVHQLGGFLIKEIHCNLLEFCLCAHWNLLRVKAILSLCSSAPRTVKTS